MHTSSPLSLLFFGAVAWFYFQLGMQRSSPVWRTYLSI